MSALLSAAATAAPLAAGWSVHSLWMRRRFEAARRDPLTGLLTRDAFTSRAQRLLSEGAAVVVVIDLDGFKAVNDSYGHAAGDAALATVGDRLTVWSASRGIVGRLGGDEFAAVITDADDLPDDLADLHQMLCETVSFEDRPLPLGASIGAVHSVQLPAADLSAALRRADEAMYDAKRTGCGWLILRSSEPTHNTVNGRRAGRDGAHLSTVPEGSAS
ncbi:GGDEF domain-containing protein [Actinacidiphila oryziradicis]|uniref:GGDEF domain-containing protein n=1 Tax=Actinacidiphila oryziradicis TaxID=2571141 RepID=A0A4U0RVW4_9ACTN|nr:GGDEF domain-containing protein [Actinacidiphila oryziradicis]TJZ99702.1 GGDEF domain-containing protein [Actinacidiphila oryziradicis]